MPSTGINGNRNSPHVQDIQYGQLTKKNSRILKCLSLDFAPVHFRSL